MPITPSNPTIETTQTVELTTTIANAIWSIVSGAGSLGAGSTAYKRIFTSVVAGQSVVRAAAPPAWTSYTGEFSLDPTTKTLTTTGQLGNHAGYPTGTLENVGDYFEHILKAGITSGSAYIYFVCDTGNLIAYFNGTTVNLKNAAETVTYGSATFADGDTLKGVLVDNGAGAKNLRLILNPQSSGNAFVTAPLAINSISQIIIVVANNVPVGTVLQPFNFSSAAKEQTTVTVIGETTRPTDVTLLTIDSNFNISSDAATDNVAVSHYITQYRDNGGAWGNFTSQLRQFLGNQNVVTSVGTHTREIRRKAVDTSGNESLNWSNMASVQYVVLPPPPAPIAVFSIPAYVQKNKNFQAENHTSGATSFVWYRRPIGGEFAEFSTDTAPLTNLPVAGIYQIKLKAIGGNGEGETETVKNITVTDLPVITFCHKRPLDEDFIQTITIDENLDLGEDVSEDEPFRSHYNMTSMYVGDLEKQELWDFLYARRLRDDFLWHDPDHDTLLMVKLIQLVKAQHMLNYGAFDFVLEYIHDV